MEDPDFHVEYVATVKANDLDESKDKWAIKTNHIDQYWNPETKTYWGWKVVEAVPTWKEK